jgi:hypothetical protein
MKYPLADALVCQGSAGTRGRVMANHIVAEEVTNLWQKQVTRKNGPWN